MRRELNPYNPGSGLRPRVMGGRREEIDAFDLMVARAGLRLPSRGMILSGLRGVGKTVLLNHLRDHADNKGWLTVQIEGRPEAHGSREVRDKLARELHIAARRYRSRRSVTDALAAASRTIQAFTVSVGAGGMSAGMEFEPGRADSGRIDIDLEELVEDISAAMRADHTAFGIFIDEMQDLDPDLLRALVTVQHIAGQRGWPFYVIGAGLPNLPTTLSQARTYAERLFDYRVIGPLDRDGARYAVIRPAQEMGAAFEEAALERIVRSSGGYPYFIQEFGAAIWEVAPRTPFSAEDAALAVDKGWRHLDAGFFPARWGKATPKERRYMRAMAVDGEGPSTTRDVASRQGVQLSSLGPTRAQLIGKGLIFSPDHGKVAFTVPGMAGFIDRQYEP